MNASSKGKQTRENLEVETNNNGPENDVCFMMVGEWGKWQLQTVIIIFLLKIPASWFMACIIFTGSAIKVGEFVCDVKAVFKENNLPADQPYEYPFYMDPNGSLVEDHCNIIIKDKDTNLDRTLPCSYHTFLIDEQTSLVTQYDLVCSREILVALSQSFHLSGVLFGTLVGSTLMGYFSPRKIMIISLIFQIPIGIATGLMPNYWLHVILRCMAATSVISAVTCGNSIMMDITGGKYKTIVAANFEQLWAIGIMVLPAICYFTTRWREIYIAISVPSILLILLGFFIPDSPKWHLKNDNIEIAKNILLKGHEINNKNQPIPSNIDNLLKRQSMDLKAEESRDLNSGWKHLLSLEGVAWKIVCAASAWSIAYICYYGTLLNTRTFGRDHIYFTTLIAGASEFLGTLVGFCIIMASKYKWRVIGAIVCISGLFPFIIWSIPKQNNDKYLVEELMSVQMLNKAGINVCLCILYTCTVELFPAPHKRRAGFGCTVIMRILFIIGPFLGYTYIFGQEVPLCVFGGMTIVNGILLMVLQPRF